MSKYDMCGISGIISNDKIDGDILKLMTDTLYHRGPDDAGYVVLNDGKVGFGNRRLSIIDLSKAGHQPMCLDEKYWITYNGEIFNFLEIRKELEKIGHKFYSRVDTEVIIHAYQEWGKECLKRLNGMFAFAIWDDIKKQLFIARDRFGIKPLYYTIVNNILLFASEFKTFLSYPGFSKEIDIDGLTNFLLFLWIADPKTIFKHVQSLPAGYFLIYDNGQLNTQRYWDVDLQNGYIITKYKDIENELDERLKQAVRRQMISDVPIGVLLSGGIDSSSIVALMSKFSNNPVKTYTIVFRDTDMRQEAMPNDAEYAQKVSKIFNTEHHEIVVDPEITDLLPKIIWHLDDPLADPAAINTYLISKMAKENGTTVLLTGVGGDEIFSGYRKHLATLLSVYYRKIPKFLREDIWEPFITSFIVAGQKRGYRFSRWLKRFTKNASLDSVQCFLGNYTYFHIEDLNNALIPELNIDGMNYAFTQHFEMFRRSASFDYINQMCYVDTKLFLSNLNLIYTDKAMMAVSVEGRPPLLDYELVDFVFRIPGKLKIHNFIQKYIFKKVMEKYLPKSIIYRSKSPFGVPLRSWTRKQLLPMINDLYSESAVKRRGIFNYDVIRKMIDDNTAGREDYAHRIWCLLTLELWFQQFIDSSTSRS